MDIEIEGLKELEQWASDLAPKLEAKLSQVDKQAAETMASMVKANTPVGVVNGGRTRESIYSRSEHAGGVFDTTVLSDYPVAYFLEFGTGPVAAAAGYPGEVSVPHVTEGWTYWSDYAAQQRAAKDPNGKENGFVYTRGQPPRAMFYNAAKAFEPAFERMIADAVREVVQ